MEKEEWKQMKETPLSGGEYGELFRGVAGAVWIRSMLAVCGDGRGKVYV